MRRPSARKIAGLVGLGAAAASFACNALSGVGDLQETDGEDAGALVDSSLPSDDARKDTAPPFDTAPPPGVDAQALDAGAEGGVCKDLPMPSFLGAARTLPGYDELVPATVGVAGAIYWPTTRIVTNLDVTFDFALGTTGVVPAAGIAFFVLTTPGTPGCNPGASICTLGSSPGYAVVLRTARAVARDPEVPYLAVVDARTYPTSPPTTPLLLDASAVEDPLQGASPSKWHTMAIHVVQGAVDVSIDGKVELSAPLPSVVGLGTGVLGIGASTGAAQGAELIAVKNVSISPCP